MIGSSLDGIDLALECKAANHVWITQRSIEMPPTFQIRIIPTILLFFCFWRYTFLSHFDCGAFFANKWTGIHGRVPWKRRWYCRGRRSVHQRPDRKASAVHQDATGQRRRRLVWLRCWQTFLPDNGSHGHQPLWLWFGVRNETNNGQSDSVEVWRFADDASQIFCFLCLFLVLLVGTVGFETGCILLNRTCVWAG